MQLFDKKNSFTLIELLMVITIIGILSATVLVAVNYARKSSRDIRAKNDLVQVRTQLAIYRLNKNSFNGLGWCSNGECNDPATQANSVLNSTTCTDAAVNSNWSVCDDVDSTKKKLVTLAKDITKQVNYGSYGMRLRGKGENAFVMAWIPSKFDSTSATTINTQSALLCYDTKGTIKEYASYFGPAPYDTWSNCSAAAMSSLYACSSYYYTNSDGYLCR